MTMFYQMDYLLISNDDVTTTFLPLLVPDTYVSMYMYVCMYILTKP